MPARKWSDADQIVYEAFASGVRLALAGEGIISGGVPSQAATPAMKVSLTAGSAVIGGAVVSWSAQDVTITTAPTTATYTRQDLIYLTAAGPQYAAGVEGAPPSDASYPDPLALPSGIPIALVEVGNAVTTILDSRIVDIRSIAHQASVGDPHPQYETTAEVAAQITTHAGAADPHSVYALDTDLTTHAAAADPHTGYQKESEKSQANGYASLGATTKVPIAELPTGTTSTTVALGDHTTPAATATVAGHVPTPPNNTTTFLRGDMTFAAPPSGSGGTPALTLGTANTAGAASTFIRTDDTILAFDATVPAANGTAATGSATTAARRDHVHALQWSNDPNTYDIDYWTQTAGATPQGGGTGGTMNPTTGGGADANSGGASGNFQQGQSQNLTNAAATYALLRMARWMVQTVVAVTQVDFSLSVKTTDFATYDAATANHMGFNNVGVGAAANWFATNANGTTETRTDTTVLANTTSGFLFSLTFDGTTARYYVNGTLRATHTTNLPTGAARYQTFGVKTSEAVTKRIGVSMMSMTMAAS